MEQKLEDITPAKAEAWLNKNSINRTLREGLAEKYADDMKKGRWTQCIVPIAFYEDGELADGQHRLYGISLSGTTQRFFVLHGLQREDGLNIDTGLNRNLVDNGRISGLDPNLTNTLVAVCRAISQGERGGRENTVSNASRLEWVAEYREAAEWAVSHGPTGRNIRNAPVLAAVARAWYYEGDKERLARFSKVLSSGFADGPHESAAVAMRNYLINKKGISSIQGWRETFLKTQNAIHYFLRGKKLTVIRNVTDEAYPLPKSKAKTQKAKPAVEVKTKVLKKHK